MKLTESHLRNLIKQELKQFLKLNEGYDDMSDLDSLDAEISDEDEDEELNALEPDLEPYVSPYKPGSTKIVSPREIKDDADELGLYDMDNPLHRTARTASRFARK